MSCYKPEGATHYVDGKHGTLWYKRWGDAWSVWWPACGKWRPSFGEPVAAKPVVSDTGANQ